MQTEQAKSSHFDRARGLKNQIFPTLGIQEKKVVCHGCFLKTKKKSSIEKQYQDKGENVTVLLCNDCNKDV